MTGQKETNKIKTMQINLQKIIKIEKRKDALK